MFNKLYEKCKNYIKENYKFILIMICMYLVLTFPLPFYIYTTGGTININDRVEITDEYQAKGSFNFAYVSELRATLPTYLLSSIIPSWQKVKIEDYKLDENETVDDVGFRDRLSLEEANQSAIKVAYSKAEKNFEITNRHHYIVYISGESNTDLKIGDEIIEVNGKKINTLDDYREIVNQHAFHDELKVKVKRNEKEENKTIEVQNMEGKKLTGLSITTIYDYKLDPQTVLKFHKTESGPSGGLMLSLSIYNKLIKEDITYGKKIVGTGTIDEDGNVGEIGGVLYKLRGAVKDKADIFIVPYGQNYIDCKNLKEKEHMNITIIPVKTFDEALFSLKKIAK